MDFGVIPSGDVLLQEQDGQCTGSPPQACVTSTVFFSHTIVTTWWEGCCWTEINCRHDGRPICPSPTLALATTETTSTTSTASPKVTSGAGAPATASGIDSSDSTTRTSEDMTAATNATLLPTDAINAPSASSPTTPGATNEGTGDNGKPALPTPMIVGVSVGGALVVIGLLAAIVLLVRRHKLRKRVPSFVDAGVDQGGEKHMTDNGPSRYGSGNKKPDVFAPFGGRENSTASSRPDTSHGPENPQAAGQYTDINPKSLRQSQLSTVANSYIVSPVSPNTTGSSTFGYSVNPATIQEQPGTVVQLDSRPLHFELDSDSTVNKMPGVVELPATTATDTIQGSNSNSASASLNHPSPLTPGFPIAAPGQLRRDAAQQGKSATEAPTKLRATLNPTPDERNGDHHVTSWAQL